jgi:hypothetical protein
VRVAYFTAGTVGAGHLVRGVAIGRGLARAGFAGEYRLFGPGLPFPAALARTDYEAVEIETDRALRDRHLAQGSALARRLAAFAPDLLLVDMFWAPLYWVLPALQRAGGCAAWLLVRTCPPHWLAGPPGMPFTPGPYERILAIEPGVETGLDLSRLGRARLDETIDPIVVANPGEHRPAGALRERLGLAAGDELVAIVHAGARGELPALHEAAAAASPAVLNLFDPAAPFPAAEWLGGADRVVCGGGYNAFWEARWLGYAERTTFVPFRRTIDDQARRLTACRDIVPRANGADELARRIVG